MRVPMKIGSFFNSETAGKTCYSYKKRGTDEAYLPDMAREFSPGNPIPPPPETCSSAKRWRGPARPSWTEASTSASGSLSVATQTMRP